jgi:O-antigen/teichoic acid export membrane protein
LQKNSSENQSSFDFDLKKQSLHSLRHGLLVLVGVLITVVLNIVLTYHLSASYYGDYSVIIRNTSFIALILTFGFDVSANRYLSNYIITNRDALAKGFLVISLCVLTGTCLIYLIGLESEAPILKLFHKHNPLALELNTPWLWFWLTTWMAFLQLGMVYLRSVNRADAGFFWGTIAQYAFLLIGIFLWLDPSLDEASNFHRVLNLTLLSYSLAVVMMAFEIFYYLIKRIQKEKEFQWRTRKWIRVSGVMMGNSVISLMVPALILNIVEWMPTIADSQVGVFALGVTICGSFGLIPSFTVKGSVMAWMKPLFKTNQVDKLSQLIVYSNWASILFNGVCCIVMGFFGHILIAHLPKVYEHSYPLFMILMLSYLFDPSLTATRSALMMMGKQNEVLIARIATIIVLLIFGGGGAYYTGIIGAAVGLVITQVLIGILDMALLKRLGFKSL